MISWIGGAIIGGLLMLLALWATRRLGLFNNNPSSPKISNGLRSRDIWLDAATGRSFGAVVHDIQGPLGVLMARTRMLSSGSGGKSPSQLIQEPAFLKTLSDAIESMKGALQNFSSFGQDARSSLWREASCAELLQKVADLNYGRAMSRRLEFAIHWDQQTGSKCMEMPMARATLAFSYLVDGLILDWAEFHAKKLAIEGVANPFSLSLVIRLGPGEVFPPMHFARSRAELMRPDLEPEITLKEIQKSESEMVWQLDWQKAEGVKAA